MIRILSYFLKIIYLFTELFVFGCAGSSLMHGLFSSDVHHTVVASVLWALARGAWAQQLWLLGSGAQAQLLWCTG